MFTKQEERDIRDLDDKIVKLAKKVWNEHPNNPKNKPALIPTSLPRAP